MLSCLVPPRFGQEDKIMPSSTAFSLQFPSLASSLHHHNSNKDDDSVTTPHADYFLKCPQCHLRLPGFQALHEHIESEHPADKQHFDNSSSTNYHQDSFSSSSSSSNNNTHNTSNSNNKSNNNSHPMIPGTPSPPISTTPIGGAAAPADLSAATAAHLSAAAAHHQHHHQQQQQQHNHHHRLQQHHHHQQQQHAMAMAIAAGMTRTSPPTSATTLNGLLAAGGNGAGVSGVYDEGGGRSTSSPSSSTTTTTLGDICGALGSAMVMGPGGPHGCAQCTAAFPTRELLEKHEMMHSPNTTVSCKVCHKTFANVYRLQRHMISHDESALLRKFKCTECDKAFKFKHHLKEHVRIHSGEKPFACDNCGKRFSHSGSYSSHMTSKKCISMGLKLNNNRSIMKSLEKAGGPLGLGSPNSKRGLVPNSMGYFPPGLPNVGLTGGLNNNNSAASPNNNAFYPILPKYSNYDAMNAALLASFQNPFYGMAAALDPRIHPYSIHRLLELTAAGNSHNKDLLNCNYIENGNKTPSLHSDPEDMIEEVTEDVPKLVMDLGDDEKPEQKFHKSQPNSPMNSNYESYLEHDSGPPSNQHEDPTPGEGGDMMKEEEQQDSISNEQQDSPDIKVEDNTDEESKESTLQCGRCDKKFNHQTELVQHEKVLCGLLDHQQRREASHEAEPQNSSYFHSGSDEDAEDRESKTGSECERKVRVRTAITEEQQSILKEHYALNARPSREEFRIIAGRLGLDARVVQVWFQNNRSRERKLNSFNLVNKNFTSPILGQSSASPTFSPTSSSTGNAGRGGAGASGPAGSGEDQPLDLSIKKEMLHAIRSPQYGTAPQQSDISEAINLSRKSSLSPSPYRTPYYAGSAPYRSVMMRHTPSPNEAVPRQPQTNPYMLPSARGLVPMECLLQMTPEYARSQLLGLKLGERGTSLSPGSEKRSWRDDDSRISHDDEFGMMHATGKRLKLEANGNPDIDCPFVCDQCDKAFSKQSSLARHKYEHSGQRPYKCEECPKAFKHKHHLTEHKRLHSGEKPFQCTKCLKRFSHSGSYSQHMNHRYSYCKPYRE